MTVRFLLVGALALSGCGSPARQAPPINPGESLEFTGTWNAVGTRRALALGAGRDSSIIDLKGSLLLAGANRPGVGFQSAVIGLVDTATGLDGRSVWTDERGDQVFSELHGEGTAANNRVTGRILSGTGRYSGITGTYEFSWQRLQQGDDDTVQGRAVDLKGSARIARPAAGEQR